MTEKREISASTMANHMNTFREATRYATIVVMYWQRRGYNVMCAPRGVQTGEGVRYITESDMVNGLPKDYPTPLTPADAISFWRDHSSAKRGKASGTP